VNFALPIFIAALVAGLGDGTRWDFRGPQNLSGVTYTLLLDPENANVYFAGSAEALWKSTDAGASWRAVPALDGLQVMTLVRDPRNHDVIYAATGFEGIGSDGIYKSEDRGVTWRRLPGSPVSPTIRSLAISPDDSRIMLAGTSSGVFRSVDGGEQWTRVVATGVNSTVAFSPSDGSHAVAGTRDEGEFSGAGHVLYSTDGGMTFHDSTGAGADTYSVFVTYAPSIPGRVYAAAGDSSLRGSVSRSDDDGKTFKDVAAADAVSGYHIRNTLLATPNADYLIYGGVDSVYAANGEPLKKTPRTSSGRVSWPHFDFLSIVADPQFDGTSNRRIFACTDGGIFVSDDFTKGGWRPLWHGAASTQYYSIDVSARGTIAGGMQDNGISIMDGSQDVDHQRDADTTNVIFDPTNDQNCFAAEFGRIFPCDGNPNAPIASAGASFGTPMAIPPSDPTRLFAASASVVRIDDIRGTHKVTTIRSSDGKHYGALAVHPANADVVWIANDAGTLYRTVNATAASPQWTTMFTSTPALSAALASTIVIDRHDPHMMYAGGGSGILKSTDEGATWQATTFPPIAVRKIVEHPATHGWLYAATASGLFVSSDSGANWSKAPGATAPIGLDIRDLVFQPATTTLYLATFGRGIWSANVPAASSPHRRGVSAPP
jgi:photosystem II stability/assembly factor-like uncharacterized protein